MLFFYGYAQQKFELLNRHRVYLRQEQVEAAVLAPDQLVRRGRHYFARKEGVEAVYVVEDETKRIITFYPVK